MGTHPSGPSILSDSNQSLLSYVNSNQSAVGIVPHDCQSNDLPFLFKVLSVRTALSIQAHPDKALAQILHTKFPDIYKDPNHKPEMAIALTPFEALSGFRRLSEIKDNLSKYPEFACVVQNSGTHKRKNINIYRFYIYIIFFRIFLIIKFSIQVLL
jgi:mannose-6-phosphate isomerase